ncbi:Ig-like domain-containing protein [Mycobacterium sp. CVI_P3]|uniref:Ig-like domain-containing protein n=1 Tax=Mycobacterium pinniadriaticum TaxID=2994102 RepID=A0ABT3S956_9MYCO|nr:Ig-like domain-containing protein [Mycobacterium pinniadriaticum]MCX2929609.1 Ig-like domain-containing protein [Mycobacterium pinniadriaticum]MCX2936033.1 Ig-like domain-containing protein [Mycobacterium pinniadriaticum]
MQQVASAVGVAPKAGTPAVSAPLATTGLVTGTLGFIDNSGQALTYTYTDPANGTVAVAADGTYSYLPTVDARLAAAGGTGPATDTFTVTAFNGIASAHETVTVPISPDIPVAGTPTVGAPDPITGAITGAVTATDPASQPLTYSITTGPAKGTITDFDSSTGAFTYTPTTSSQLAAEIAGAVGADTFTVSASNGAASATVTIHVVVDPGTPQADNPTIDTTDTRTGVVTGTAAFTDPAGGELMYSVSTNPANGTVTVDNEGFYTYTPNGDTTETVDSFAVTVTNGVHSAAETISVPINTQDAIVGTWEITSEPDTSPAPDNWIATITRTGDEYTQTIVWTYSGGETDTWHYGTFTRTDAGNYTATSGEGGDTPEGEHIDEWTAADELHWLQDSYGDDAVISDLVYDPYTLWTLNISDEGNTFTETHNVTETYTVTLPADHTLDGFGETSFTTDGLVNVYTFDDSWSETLTATLVSDSTVVDVPEPGTPIVSAADPDTGVVTGMAVFTDPEGATLTYSVSTGPTKGVITEFDSGTGAFIYTPDGDASGTTDSFAVTASNGIYRATETISVPITSATQDAIVGVWNVTSITVANSDGSDPEAVEIPEGYEYAFTFTVADNGYTAAIEFADGNDASVTVPLGTLTETVAGTYTGSATSEDPQAVIDSWSGQGISVEVSDYESATKSTVVIAGDGTMMTYTLEEHDSYTITLPSNITYADDSATLLSSDDSTSVYAVEYSQLVTLSAVKAVDTPVAGTPVVSAADPDTGVVTGMAVFTDPEGVALTYSVSTDPTKGIITDFDSSTGEFVYTPNDDATGIRDTFTVTATNGIASATQTIAVPINSATQDALAGTWEVTGTYVDGELTSAPADFATLNFSDTGNGYASEMTFSGTTAELTTWLGAPEPVILFQTEPGTYSGSYVNGSSSTVTFTASLSDDELTLTWIIGFVDLNDPQNSYTSPFFTAVKTEDVINL